jgi:hypothetical protein
MCSPAGGGCPLGPTYPHHLLRVWLFDHLLCVFDRHRHIDVFPCRGWLPARFHLSPPSLASVAAALLRLCAAALLRLCASAFLRLCASALLRFCPTPDTRPPDALPQAPFVPPMYAPAPWGHPCASALVRFCASVTIGVGDAKSVFVRVAALLKWAGGAHTLAITPSVDCSFCFTACAFAVLGLGLAPGDQTKTGG